MVQGCTSHAGKSYLTAALCRLLADDGLRVAPFKAQNMSNNAGVTADGRELGRAQIVQAAAARIAPEARMNPVLVKPEADTRSQVVVLGEVDHELSRLPWRERRASLWPVVRSVAARADGRLRRRRDRGRGQPGRDQPARRRHRQHGASRSRSRAPVLLCCDIDRGGAFAHLLGTWHCLRRSRARPARGLPAQPLPRRRVAARARARSGSRSAPACPMLGVVPWLDVPLPEEDGVALQGAGGGEGRIAIVALPRIANLDEFAPLGARTRASSAAPAEIEAAAAIVIPGTKSTLADLEWLRSTGLAGAIARRAAAGVPVLGICGGFQMLGRARARSATASRAAARRPGLGLLDLVTELQRGQDDPPRARDRQRDGRATRRLRDPPRRDRRRSDGDADPDRARRGRSAGAPETCVRATCTGCWSTRPTATRCSAGRASSPARRPRASTPASRRSRRTCARPSTGRASAPSSDARPDTLRACSATAWRATRCSATTPWRRSSAAGGACCRTSASRSTTPRRCGSSARRGRPSRTTSSASTPTSCSSWSPRRRGVHAARAATPRAASRSAATRWTSSRAGAAVRARGRRAARGDVRRLLPLHEAGAGLRRLRHRRRPAVRAERPAARLAPPRHAARAADAHRQALQRRAGLARRRARLARAGRHGVRRRRGAGARAGALHASSTSTRRCSTTSACSTRCWSTRPPASR